MGCTATAHDARIGVCGGGCAEMYILPYLKKGRLKSWIVHRAKASGDTQLHLRSCFQVEDVQ